jgi:iron only hydrogenase large subunit-like protein
MELIHLNQEKCTQCMLCVQVCPVRAIKLGRNQEFPEILHDRCTGCGSCLKACADDAITYHDSIPAVKDLLASDHKVAAVVDPSIAAEFPDITDYRKFAGMLRLLDFAWVSETAFAVEVIAEKYNNLLKDFKGKYYLSANCPTLVLHIEKYQPQLLKNLVPLLSPMCAMAMIMREEYGDDIKIVGVVPCISAKIEAARSEGKAKVDEVITFTELRTLFKGKDISESALEFSDFDPPHGRHGSLYPIANGFVQVAGLNTNLLESKIRTAAGKQNFLNGHPGVWFAH